MSVQFKGGNPAYLGDAVYASFDGYHIWLETTNGVTVLDSIALEPAVFNALLSYHAIIYKPEGGLPP